MKNTVTLYRGDSSKVTKFDLNKTDKHCMWGQGIYLTDDVTIAHTYRVKGLKASKPYDPVLYEGYEPKQEIINKAFQRFIDLWLDNNMNLLSVDKLQGVKSKPLDKLTHAQLVKAKFLWEDLPIRLVKKTAQSTEHKVGYNIIYDPMPVGRITQFVFDRQELDHNTISMEKSAISQGLQEIVLQHFNQTELHMQPIRVREGVGDVFVTVNEAVVRSPGIKLSDYYRNKTNAIRSHFSPWGYYGLRYNGGVITTGKRHNCYVLWDDAYVNAHKHTVIV